jgi:RimJ/RimL family protein N-acetyltransferase
MYLASKFGGEGTMILPHLSGYGVELRPIQEGDLAQLLNWRNREDIRGMMKSQDIISMPEHIAWFKGLVTKQHVQHFAVCYKGALIGAANIMTESDSLNFCQRIEPGLYIGEEKFRGNILAFAPSLVLNDYCFETLNVSGLIATVNSKNSQAITYNEKLGYQIVERGEWLSMTLNIDDYLAATKMVRRFLSRGSKNTDKRKSDEKD